MNYSELKTNIAGYFNRGDLTTKVPKWVELAEAFLFREISPNTVETSVSGTTTGTISLPADFSSLIRLDLVVGGRPYSLDYTTQGTGFVIDGETIRLTGFTTIDASYTLHYAPNMAALSDTNPTNWLLDNGYDLYFYVSALEGARALKNDGEIGRITPMIPTLLDSVKGKAKRVKFPTSGSLQIKPRSAI